MTALANPEEYTVHRIAGMPPDEETLKKYGLDPDPAPPGITDSVEADAWNNLYYVLTNGSDSRYCDGSFGVAYTALQQETAIAEKGYWVTQLVFQKPDPPDELEVLQMELAIRGAHRSFLRPPDYDPELTHPTKYKLCQNIGKESQERGLDFIVVPSARKQAGINAPVFSLEALPEVKPGQVRASISSYIYAGGRLTYRGLSGGTTVSIEDVYPDWSHEP